MPKVLGGSWVCAAMVAILSLGCGHSGDDSATAAPLGLDRAQLWQYITTGNADGSQAAGELPAVPFYTGWELFPGPPDDPEEFFDKRLGLATHGRWVTVYANPLALHHIESYLEQVATVPVDGTPVIPATEFPPGSVIVKVNFANDPNASTVQRAAQPQVLTVAYKPDAGFCESGVRYNGTDCLGGEWLWAFYGLGKAQAMDRFITDQAGTFCINCHTPGFKSDYLRGLESRARRIAFDRVPETDARRPGSVPDDDPFCEGTIKLSSDRPTDVAIDPASITDPARRNRLFDCLAWRSFVALNWPAGDHRGEPNTAAPFGRPTGDRVWETFAQTYEVFQPDDLEWKPPADLFETARRIPSVCEGADPGAPVISMITKSQSHDVDLVNETGQAFAGTFGTLTDRNGKLVHYQVLFNETEFGFFLAGDKAATRNLTPIGPADGPEPLLPDGATEVKAAWKQLCLDESCAQRDQTQDYYTRTVWIYDDAGPTCQPMEVGLIGLHVSIKTFWAPQWIWATFEHRANAPLAHLVADGKPPEIPPGDFLFYDASCPPDPARCFRQPFLEGAPAGADPCCPNLEINRFPGPGFDSSHNNQMIRLDTPDSSGLNPGFQQAMADAGSPLAHLFLVNTQWPMNGRRPAAASEYDSPSAALAANTRNCVDNALSADGSCYTRIPRFLRNTVIESYMTTWVNNDQDHPQQISNRSCMSCHASGTDFSYIFEDAVELTVRLDEDGP